jgi:hypothetical protein
MSVATNEFAPTALDGEAGARELFRTIRTLAERVRTTLDAAFSELESLTELVIQAHDDRAWRRINHTSWEECCKKEFGAIRLLRLPRGMRKELHLALRDGGLSVRHTASVTGCSKNTVLEDCSAEKASQTGTPESRRERNDDALARDLSGAGAQQGTEEPDSENVTPADTPKRNVEHLNVRYRPASPWQESARANGARVNGNGPADPMRRVAAVARAVSCDIANLVSLAKLARRDGKTPPELAEYLGPKVETWISTLGSLVEDAAGPTPVP